MKFGEKFKDLNVVASGNRLLIAGSDETLAICHDTHVAALLALSVTALLKSLAYIEELGAITKEIKL